MRIQSPPPHHPHHRHPPVVAAAAPPAAAVPPRVRPAKEAKLVRLGNRIHIQTDNANSAAAAAVERAATAIATTAATAAAVERAATAAAVERAATAAATAAADQTHITMDQVVWQHITAVRCTTEITITMAVGTAAVPSHSPAGVRIVTVSSISGSGLVSLRRMRIVSVLVTLRWRRCS